MYELSDLKELILLPAFVGWFAARGERPVWAFWAVAQLGLATGVEIIGKSTMVRGINNHALYNTYMLVEYGLLSMVLLTVVPKNRTSYPFALGGACVFAIAYLLDLLSRGTFFSFASSALIVGGALLAVQAALLLWRLMLQSDKPLYTKGEFWILVSIALYFFCFIPVLGLYNHLVKISSPLADRVYKINDILFVLRYGTTAVAFWLMEKRKSG